MRDKQYTLEGEDLEAAKLDLFIRILAETRANSDLLIELLCEKGHDPDKLTAMHNQQKAKYDKRIREGIYEDFGKLDIDSLLKGG